MGAGEDDPAPCKAEQRSEAEARRAPPEEEAKAAALRRAVRAPPLKWAR